MKPIYFSTLLLVFILGSLTVQAQNPYKEFGIEVEPLTLSKGKYNEFFTNDSLVHIGSVILDTRNNRIASFVVLDTAYSEATLEPEVSSRFLSPDPYAADYPNLSPYSYVANNPLLYTDPTGKYIVDSNGNRVEVTTTQDEDGNYVNSFTFAEGTEQSVIDGFHANGGTILNAMALTEEGRTQLGNLVDAEHGIGLNLSEKTEILDNGAPRLGLTTIRGGKIKADGSIDLSNATTTINVYEGSINEMANLNYQGKWGDFKSMGKIGMIGATGSHEAVHATSKENMKLGTSHPEYETAPNKAVFRYVEQFLKRYK